MGGGEGGLFIIFVRFITDLVKLLVRIIDCCICLN